MITNKAGLSISMAAWLAADTYDYDPTAVSTTALIKPVKQSILKERVNDAYKKEIDVQDIVKSRTGTSIHDSIESVWKDPILLERTLRKLESTASLFTSETVLIGDIVDVNPTEPSTKPIVIHLETRKYKMLNGFKLSGKYDFVLNGVIEDHKSTSAYTYTKGLKAEDYILQGSIYRWLVPDIITKDYININFLFTDWKQGEADRNEAYPKYPTLTVTYPLMSLEATEDWLIDRINQIKRYRNSKEEDIPSCTAEELWQDAPVFKYYADPTKTSKSTKNFDNSAEAYEYKASKGKGVVLEVAGKAKACTYCPASPICQQYQKLVENGLAD